MIDYKNSTDSHHLYLDSIQLFHTFQCNSQNYNPQSAVDDSMHCFPEDDSAKENIDQQCIGSSKAPRGSFDYCTERYEIVVLLPNSEHTKGNNIKYKLCDADAPMVRLHRRVYIRRCSVTIADME